MAYILSTMTSGVDYTIYKKTPGGLSVPVKTISVNGGANVQNTRTLITPQGITTSITDEDLELLMNHPVFKIHLEKGFVKVVKTEKVDTKGMEVKDKSAQLTADDFKKKGKKAPKTNKQ